MTDKNHATNVQFTALEGKKFIEEMVENDMPEKEARKKLIQL